MRFCKGLRTGPIEDLNVELALNGAKRLLKSGGHHTICSCDGLGGAKSK